MAISSSTFSDIGSAVSDLFAVQGYKYKAEGDLVEQQNYIQAAGFADQNAQFTAASTAIKQAQESRDIYKSLGETRADVAGAGFAESGSAMDILRDSASQGALTRAVMGEQGLIQEAGYREQAQSYRNMADAAGIAAKAEDTAATGAKWAAGFKIAGAVASVALAPVTGGASLLAEGASLGSGLAGAPVPFAVPG